jgi:hypothetical protein
MDEEIARRIEQATGRNGHLTLEQIRAEGLDVVIERCTQCPFLGCSDCPFCGGE